MDPASASSKATGDKAPSTNGSSLTNKNGWDGKLRVGKQAQVLQPGAISDPENSAEEDTLPVEQIAPDEGRHAFSRLMNWADNLSPDLLEDLEVDTDVSTSRHDLDRPVN